MKSKLIMRLLVIVTILLITATSSYAQINGVKTIPGDFATIKDAVVALNTQGVGIGGVIFEVSSGYAETANITLTTTGTSTKTITFRKSGTGANPVITAGVGTSTTLDAIFKLIGSDYVTIDGIDLKENSANTSTTTQAEWGFALLKPNGNDGCRLNVIKNSSITLNKANVNTVGIYIANHTQASTTTLNVADSMGANSYNKFYSNIISNVFTGISITGYTDIAPYLFYDRGNEIGTLNGIENKITNFGGGSSSTTSFGVLVSFQNKIKIFNSTINSKGGNWQKGNLYGIRFSSFTNGSSGEFYGNTITLGDSGTTVNVSGISFPSFINGGLSNSINVHDNFIQDCSFPTATSGTFTGIDMSCGSYYVDIYNNQIINNVHGSSASTATGLIQYINAINGAVAQTGALWKIYGNTISNNTRVQSSSGAGNINSINVNSNVQAFSIYNNTIENNTWQGSSGTAITGILINAPSTTTHQIYGNTIRSISSTGAASISGVAEAATLNAPSSIFQNLIYSFSSVGGNLIGIQCNSGLIKNIYKNNISGLTTTSGTVTGINTVGGTTVNLYNNFVSDLRATTASGLEVIKGISMPITSPVTNLNIFFNTVFLNAVSSNSTFGTSGLSVNSIPLLTLNNNIIVNNSTAGASDGFTVAFRRSSSNLLTYSDSSNNNVFYAGIPSFQNLIYYDGVFSEKSLSTYQGRVTPRDNFSYSELPPFSNIVTAPYNLHLVKGIGFATACESGGKPINYPLSISNDFDDNSRNITTPDIGADEGNFTFGDFAPPLITYTKLSETTSTSDRILTVSITDASGVELTSPNEPRVYYKKGITGTYKYRNATAIAGNDYSFTIVNDSLGSVMLNDTVYYYIAAQDVGPLGANIGTNPSGGSGINPPGTKAPLKPNKYIIVNGPLAGTYTIGLSLFNKASGKNLSLRTLRSSNSLDKNLERNILVDKNGIEYKSFERAKLTKGLLQQAGITGFDNAVGVYPTITAALGDLRLRGVSGPVVFELLDATYSAETLPLFIGDVAGSGALNTITIKPASGINSSITGTVNSSILKVIGTSSVIIDGSNNGSSSKNLTITNNSTLGGVIGVGSVSTTNVSNIIIKNCSLNGNSSGINSWGICLSDSSALGSVFSGTLLGLPGYFSNFVIQNNSFQKLNVGININGGTFSNQNSSNIFVLNNVMNGNTTSTQIFTTGIYIQGVNGYTLAGNELGNITTSATSISPKAIWVGPGAINGIIEKNLIYNIGYTGTSSGGGGKGIALSTGIVSCNVVVRNNMIYKIIGTSNVFSSSGATSAPVGIYTFGGSSQSGVKIYNNSINLFGNTLLSSSSDYFSIGVALDDSTAADIRNNIIVNNLGTTASSVSNGATAISAEHMMAQLTAINNNVYLVSPSGSSLNIIGKVGSNNYSTLTDWQTATGKDGSSYNFNPHFVSDLDLHINTSNPSPVEGKGAILVEVTNDYDGDVRNGSIPDIGADEMNGITMNLNPPAISYTILQNDASTTSINLSNVIITDSDGVKKALGSRPRCYYKKSTDANTYIDNTSSTNGWKYVEANGTESPFDFTILYSKLNGGTVSSGNTIQYFVIASDSASTPGVSINNGVLSTAPSFVDLAAINFPVFGTINQYSVLGGISGIVTVGTGGTYSTFTGVGGLFADMNAKAVIGDITASVISDISEPGTNSLNEFNAPYSLNIIPQGAVVRKIESAIFSTMITFNGSDRVVVDGRDQSTLGGRFLKFVANYSFASSTGNVFKFQNDSRNCSIRNCIIESNSTNSASILIGTTSGRLGNDNITIDSCLFSGSTATNIGPHSTAISSTGSGIGNQRNSNINIRRNEIYKIDASSSGSIQFIGTGNGDSIKVDSNYIYNDINLSSAYISISITGAGNNCEINWNSIGGASKSRSGSIWTTSSSSGFRGIQLSAGTTIPSEIQGNLISNFGSTAGGAIGIELLGGKVNVGTSLGNILGGGINSWDSIKNAADVGIISLNGTGEFNISKNTISNVYYSKGMAERTSGIQVISPGAKFTIDSNIIHDIYSNSSATGSGLFNTIGIYLSNSTTSENVISRNYIYNLGNTNLGSEAYSCNGIIVNSNITSLNVFSNRIYNLTSAGSGIGSNANSINGILIYAGNVNLFNNQISLTSSGEKILHGVLDASQSSSNLNVLYNSIYLDGSTSAGLNDSYCFQRISSSNTVSIKNNIFYNNRIHLGTGYNYSIGNLSSSGWTTSSSNNNLLISTTSNSVGEFNIKPGLSFISWKINSGGDENSFSDINTNVIASNLFYNPSTGDLNIRFDNVESWWVNGKGTPVTNPSVSKDFGNLSVRSTSIQNGMSDIGSNEFNSSVTPPSAVASNVPANSTTTSYSFAGKVLCSITWGLNGTVPSGVNLKYYSGSSLPGTLNGLNGNGYWDIEINGGTSFTYDINLYYDPSSIGAISKESNIKIAKRNNTDPWVLLTNSNVDTILKSCTATGLTSFSQFALTDIDNPLPVELSTFTSLIERNNVKLFWTTLNEMNNFGFEIERKSIIDKDWEKVGSVPGAGNTTHTMNYNFSESNLRKGIYNYRLKQIDYNGNFVYHNLSSQIEIGVPQKYALSQNYPNPFNPSTKINYDLPFASKINLTIFDLSGREVFTFNNERQEAGFYTITFNGLNLSSGIYFYRLITKEIGGNINFIASKKMILVK
jgi:hypothetical protein